MSSKKRAPRVESLSDGSTVMDDGFRIVETRPDGTTVIYTGVYVESRKALPDFKDMADAQAYFKSRLRIGPPDTPEDVLTRSESLAREFLAPHINAEPLKPAEVLAIKSACKPMNPGEYPDWPIVADDQGQGCRHFAVRPESRGLPIIRAASEVLTWIRRIRKKGGTPSFLAGVRLGELLERMQVVGVAERQALIGLRRVRTNPKNAHAAKDKAATRNEPALTTTEEVFSESVKRTGRAPKMAAVVKSVAGKLAAKRKTVPSKSTLERAYRTIRERLSVSTPRG